MSFSVIFNSYGNVCQRVPLAAVQDVGENLLRSSPAEDVRPKDHLMAQLPPAGGHFMVLVKCCGWRSGGDGGRLGGCSSGLQGERFHLARNITILGPKYVSTLFYKPLNHAGGYFGIGEY